MKRNRKRDSLDKNEGFVIADSEYNILFEDCSYDVFRKGSGLSDEIIDIIEAFDRNTGTIELDDRLYYVRASEIK